MSVKVTTRFAFASKKVKLLKITNISMFRANLPENIPIFSEGNLALGLRLYASQLVG